MTTNETITDAAGRSRAIARRESREQPSYFMIRVQPLLGDASSPLTGVIERLATGEKCAFESGAELLGLVASWPAARVALAREPPSPPRA
jgi:hypothetical protein